MELICSDRPPQYNIPLKWVLLWEGRGQRSPGELKGEWRAKLLKLSIQGKPLGLPIVNVTEDWMPTEGNRSWPWHLDRETLVGIPGLTTSRLSCNGETLPLGHLASQKPRCHFHHRFYKGIRALCLDSLPSEFPHPSVATNLFLASHTPR